MTIQPNSSVSYDSSPLSTRRVNSYFATASHLERAMKRVLGVAVALLVVTPAVALAQSPRQPVVELGAQGSSRTGDERHVAWSPRLTVPLKHRTAIEAAADITSFEFGGGYRRSAREFGVHWRQTVFTSGRVRVFGVLGGGRNRVETNVPERAYQLPDGRRFVEPAHTSVASEFVAHLGPAVQVELASWLALRGDLYGIIGQRDQGVRGMVGVVFPIRNRDGDQTTASTPPPAPAPPPTPAPTAWRRVKPGREVWVTTNTGSVVHGEIGAISDSSLSIREQDRVVTIRLADVRLVEGRDSLKNGFLTGGASGGLALGVLGGLAFSAWCEYECDGAGAGGFVMGAATGFAVGGLLGLMVDALIPGRQTLFGSSTTVVTPVITSDRKSIDVAIRLR